MNDSHSIQFTWLRRLRLAPSFIALAACGLAQSNAPALLAA
jgi:hypothetical protein